MLFCAQETGEVHSTYRCLSYIAATFSLQLSFNRDLTKQVPTTHSGSAPCNTPISLLGSFLCLPSTGWLSPHQRGQATAASTRTAFPSLPGPGFGCHLLCHPPPPRPETLPYLDLRKAFLTKCLYEKFGF